MKNIAKIFSLIIAIVAGLISVLLVIYLYHLYTRPVDAPIGIFTDIYNLQWTIRAISTVIPTALISIIAFNYLHKNKTKNEYNPTILDHDQTERHINNF